MWLLVPIFSLPLVFSLPFRDGSPPLFLDKFSAVELPRDTSEPVHIPPPGPRRPIPVEHGPEVYEPNSYQENYGRLNGGKPAVFPDIRPFPLGLLQNDRNSGLKNNNAPNRNIVVMLPGPNRNPVPRPKPPQFQTVIEKRTIPIISFKRIPRVVNRQVNVRVPVVKYDTSIVDLKTGKIIG